MISRCGFNCISLMTKDAEHLSHLIFAITISFDGVFSNLGPPLF